MIDVDVHVRHTLEVAWSVEEALALISDVPLSASHFPGLQRLDDLGDGVYRWNMEPVEIGRFRHQVRYSAHYITDEAANTVVWSTVGTDNNTQADGQWRVTPHGTGARLSFENRLRAQLPIPRLAARMARGLVPKITDKQTCKYLDRIAAKMGGRRTS